MFLVGFLADLVWCVLILADGVCFAFIWCLWWLWWCCGGCLVGFCLASVCFLLVIWWFGFWFVARLVWWVASLCWLYSACVLAVLLQVGLRLGFGG